MPIYEYECEKTGEVFDLYFNTTSSRTFGKLRIITCQLHPTGERHSAEKIWSKTANIQLGKPTIVFVNPQTGQAQIATSQYDSPPPGFIKEELKGPIERTKFEQQQNAISSHEDAIYNEKIRQGRESARESIIKDIDANIREDAQSSTNPEETARLMQAAKKHIEKKALVKKKRRTEFRFDVNHIDKSNL